VLLDANPLEDIRNTQKIRAVVADGQLYRRAELDRLLARVEVLTGGDGLARQGATGNIGNTLNREHG
jgi:hypothetical protein